MSAYDIAAGASPAGLNALVAQIYGNPAARQNLFKGSVTQKISTGVNVVATYEVKKVPTFVLSPPTQQQWNAAQKTPANAPLPTANAFQIALSDIAVSVKMDGVDPLTAEGAVTAFGTVAIVSNVVTLTLNGLWLDESKFSQFDKVVVNEILIPMLTAMVNKALIKGIPLPQVPPFDGFSFQPLALAVSPAGLVAATSLLGNATPDLSGFAFPPAPLFLLAKGSAVNKVLAKEVPSSVSDDSSTGPKAWSASGRVSATNLTVALALSSGVVVDVNGTFSATGEISGTGVGVTKAVLCPIGAAADAISNPSGWDKVTAGFKIVDLPNPVPIPVEVKAGAITGTDKGQKQSVAVTVPSDHLPSSIHPKFVPQWRGSVTGAALSAAAAAIVDLMLLVFNSVVMKKIVSAVGHKTFDIPVGKMTQPLNLPNNVNLKAQLSAPPGSSLQTFDGNQLLVALQVNIVS